MTKYVILDNPKGSGQSNKPGSTEAMACEVIELSCQHVFALNHFMAFAMEKPDQSLEFLKDDIRFTLEIDDARSAIWKNEVKPLMELSDKVDLAIEQAHQLIADAAENFHQACEKSRYFKEINIWQELELREAFEQIINSCPYQISDAVDEIFDIKHFQKSFI